MTIREYARQQHVEVVGRLKRLPAHDGRDPDGKRYRFYIDEAKNEYTINSNGVCIVTADGGVI